MFREHAAQSKVKKDLEDEILRLLSADGDILESKATSTDLLDILDFGSVSRFGHI